MRRLLAWLNGRFPPQLVVKLDEFKQMQEELGQYNRLHQAVVELNNRLTAVESSVKNLNNLQGVITQGKGSFRLER